MRRSRAEWRSVQVMTEAERMQQGLAAAAAVANGESLELPDEQLSSTDQLEIERWAASGRAAE